MTSPAAYTLSYFLVMVPPSRSAHYASRHGRSGRNCRVSIGALDEPVNGPRPQLFLSPAADGQSNVPGWPDDLFLVGGTDQVVERLGLGAGNEVVLAGHQVQQRAGYLAQIDDVPAQRHPVFRQQVLLEEVFRKLAIDLAGYRDVVVQPRFHIEIVIDEFVPMEVFHQVDGLFDQVGDGLQHEKGRLEKLRGDVAHGIDELIDIEVTWIGPQIDQALARGEVNAASEQDKVLHQVLVDCGKHGAQCATHAVTEKVHLI